MAQYAARRGELATSPMTRTFDSRDLVAAYLALRRYRGAADELRDFHQRRYRAPSAPLPSARSGARVRS